MYQEPELIPAVSVSPGRAAFFQVPVEWWAKGRPLPRPKDPDAPPAIPDPDGAVWRSRKKATDAAGWLFLRSKRRNVVLADGRQVPFRLGFWRLSPPDPVPEHIARAALSRWWTWGRNVAGLQSYLWTAELTKRGRVHFHALVRDWLDKDQARAAWMRCLRNVGGLSRSYASPPAQCLHVEVVDSASAARGYVAKYMRKGMDHDRATELERLERLNLERLRNAPDEPARVAALARVAEVQARLQEARLNPGPLRRWGSSQDLVRKPPVFYGPDDPRTYQAVASELRALGGRWSPVNEHGAQVLHFDLDAALDPERYPRLSSLLRCAAFDPSET